MAFPLNWNPPQGCQLVPYLYGSETCPDWLEDRPIYEDLTPVFEPSLYDINSSTDKSSQMHLLSPSLLDLVADQKPYLCSPPPDTKADTQKFETVNQDFATIPGWTTSVPKVDALTPPDSPKDDNYHPLSAMLDGFEPEECDVLEELIRLHTKSFDDEYKAPSIAGNFVYSAPQKHEDDSSDSNHSTCLSSPSFSPASSSSSSDDSDWTPYSLSAPAPTQPKKRRGSKPYSRAAPEDKKLRKKEQNKNAATRYRLKKKAEIEEIVLEEKELQDKNDELHHKVDKLAREIQCLKPLMRELFKASGLIK